MCPECIGDLAPNDGMKQGTCRVSTHLDATRGRADPGLDLDRPCDVNRYGTIPGYDGAYSMDCSATLTAGLGTPTQFGGSFSSAGFKVEITNDSPNCTAPGFGGTKCFCGMCADGVRACMSSADCGGGECGVPSSESACKPNDPASTDYDAMLPINQCLNFPADPVKFAVGGNACVDGTCTWNATKGVGSCKNKLGATIGCYPSGLHQSIIVPPRAERVDGATTIYYANTASARCTPAGRSAAVNSQLGLPGLTFQKRNFQIIPAYAEGPR